MTQVFTQCKEFEAGRETTCVRTHARARAYTRIHKEKERKLKINRETLKLKLLLLHYKQDYLL